MILAADIGGTKTELALFEDVEQRKIIKEERFSSKQYKNLEEIVLKFLSSTTALVTRACFGIAGPVENNRCHATNLPWIVDTACIQKLTKIPSIFLINDLEANAWGISRLQEHELCTLSG